MRYIKEHERQIRTIKFRLNLFNAVVIISYALFQIPNYFYTVTSEPAFSLVMFASWLLFLAALCKIQHIVKGFPNAFTNEWVTLAHFLILSAQGISAMVYALMYIEIYYVEGYDSIRSSDI